MKGIPFIVLMMALLVMVGGCSQTEVKNDLSPANEEENQTASPGLGDDNGEEAQPSETDSASDENLSENMNIDEYLNAHYKIDGTHYETDVWESDSGMTNYTVKLLPDTEEYSQEINEKFQHGHMKSYEETEMMFDMAKQIMDELPEVKNKSRVDSVSWVSYDGEFKVVLIQDFEKSKHQADGEGLSKYTSNQIEYARVWLQLGPNQEIDELNVRHIPAGEKLNLDDETSASYPEDVIQLAGSRLVDGSVTYSGNGDGTINVYNIPLRWDGKYPAGKDFYNKIIQSTKLVRIDTGDDQDVIRLIKLLNVH
ncbi:hypothetical protein [Mesobacillus selenatarsenatis]|uniref:Lipoprotein n=1 Tax=Mesobacillus selenatarsenatis (strain DSM 18680 / JCM 14380 / FERM P-15431 / SF-1) TaxID=1321606 RepID=A0A0A8X8V9_MESS1|nr:hypothetical protein SAMD00020551_3887 [Mesobacillus selenatarsenatis SF-1]